MLLNLRPRPVSVTTPTMMPAAAIAHYLGIIPDHLATLDLAGASGVVGMGGYNTFCEVLSFDKPALIVPRVKPRLEQAHRPFQPQNGQIDRIISGEVSHGIRP